MNREQNTGDESSKHISMELSAENMRVTNLSLEGGRLIMTIEADLAGSQLHGSSIPGGDALKSALLAAAPGLGTAPARPQAAPANPSGGAAAMPALGAPIPEEALSGIKTGGSEALAPAAPPPPVKPAPVAAPTPKPIPPTPPPSPTVQPPAPGQPIPLSSLTPPQAGPSIRVGDAAAPVKKPEPPAPEPKITETWDPSASALAFTPSPAPAPAAPGEIRFGDAPAPMPMSPPPAKQPPATGGAGEISLGDPNDSAGWGTLAPAGKNAPAQPAPQIETWDGGLSLGEPSLSSEPLAISEESSAVGGERHGEPQPAISFGMPPAPAKPQPDIGPAPDAPTISLGFEDAPAPTPEPAKSPDAPGAPLSFDFGMAEPSAAPSVGPAGHAAAPISLGDDSPALGFDSPAPAISLGGNEPPALEFAPPAGPSISLGDDESPTLELGPPAGSSINLGGNEPPALEFAPPAGPSISLGDDESPTLELAPPAGPSIGLGGGEAPAPEFGAPAGPAISLGGPPSAAPSIGFDSPAAPIPPAAGGAASISLGDDDGPIQLGAPGSNPGIGFETPGPGLGLEPAPQPAAKPAPAPLSLEPPSPGPERAEAPQPSAPPPPKEEIPPKREEPEPAPKPSAKSEAGGTTVLIRYTCPKCKTQGMQAVDKVGTVVNCSNCGKAMRLVMRK